MSSPTDRLTTADPDALTGDVTDKLTVHDAVVIIRQAVRVCRWLSRMRVEAKRNNIPGLGDIEKLKQTIEELSNMQIMEYL